MVTVGIFKSHCKESVVSKRKKDALMNQKYLQRDSCIFEPAHSEDQNDDKSVQRRRIVAHSKRADKCTG
jgi:hypothetical protein